MDGFGELVGPRFWIRLGDFCEATLQDDMWGTGGTAKATNGVASFVRALGA